MNQATDTFSLRPFMGLIFILATHVAILSSPEAAAEPVPALHEVAQPFVRPAHAPAATDITIRSLKFRPRDENDPYDTFKAMDQFHATRLEWVYVTLDDREEFERIQRVKATGRVFGGASSGKSGINGVPREQRHKFCIVDLAGDPVIHGFQSGWEDPPSPGCMNNPLFRQRHFEFFEQNLAMGVDTMQRDEGGQNYHWALAGVGCYCQYCMSAFRFYLAERLTTEQLAALGIEDVAAFAYDDYLRARGEKARSGENLDWSNPGTVEEILTDDPIREHFVAFQEQTNVRFYEDMRQWLHARSPVGYLPMSVNNTSFQRWERPYYDAFDFGLSELMMESADPVHMYDRARYATSIGKVQVFGTPKTMGKTYDEQWLTRLKRRVIATAYSVGALSRVPWDIFQQTTDGKGRYFGDPNDYADIYGFVRAIAPWIEGYRDAGALGPGIEERRYGDAFPVVMETPGEQVYVFLRAVPGDAEAADVMHIVDWREDPAPLRLRIRHSAFTGTGLPKVRLLRPAEYNAGEHMRAEAHAQAMRRPGERLGSGQHAAYADLVDEQAIETTAGEGWTVIELPALRPWGVLVIER